VPLFHAQVPLVAYEHVRNPKQSKACSKLAVMIQRNMIFDLVINCMPGWFGNLAIVR
jgi:hypothetical protein